MTARLSILLAGVLLWVPLAGPSRAAPARATPSDVPARIDLYDKGGRIYLVVYYARMDQEPGGAVRFVKPRAVMLAREGKTTDEMIRNPVAEITGATGVYDAARQTLHVDGAHSVFHMGVTEGADARPDVPVTVVSKRLDAFPEESRAVYAEDVKLVREGMTLLADRLEVRWDAATRKLRTAEATGAPAVVTRKAGERLEAVRIELDMLLGKAVIPSGTGGRASFLAPGMFREGEGSR